MAWDDTKETADDPCQPDADEQLTADEYNSVVDFIESLDTSVDGLQNNKLDIVDYTPVTDVDAEVTDAASSVSQLDNVVKSLDDNAARRSELFESAQEYYVSTDGDNSNDGRSWRDAFASIERAVEQVKADRGDTVTPASIVLEAGQYFVDNPLKIPEECSVVGRDLKTCQLYPLHPKMDFFHVDSMTFFIGLRFYNHQSPSFCFSFPRTMVEPEMSGGEVVDATILYTLDGYKQGDNDADPVPVVDPPRNGSQAEVDLTVSGGKVTDVTVTDGGSGYQTKPNISVPAPEDEQPFVTASPYPLNCSSITGPFDENGDQIPQSAPLPYDTDGPTFYNPETGKVESYAAIDEEGAGGGIITDGRLCYGKNEMTPVDNNSTLPASPLNSFVTAQFTQVNQGGPGHLLVNGGFAQFVSSFTTFCTYGFKCKTGGEALLSNSVCDFGNEGLIAEGRGLDPYTTADIVSDERSKVAAVSVDNGGSGYSDPTITIDPPATGTQAQADASIEGGEIASVTVTDSGSGYKSTPGISVSGGGSNASLSVEMNNVGSVTIDNLDIIEQPGGIDRPRRPEITSIITLPTASIEPIIESWTENNDGTYDVSFAPAVPYVNSGDVTEMFELSKVNTGSHTFEYPGTGVTYNALPEYGGVTDYAQMTKEFGVGRVFHTSSDERGNFYVGSQFRVNQQSGEVTLNTDQFNLSGLNAIGPFTVNGVTRGVQLREVSDRDDMVSNSGLGGNTAPTVRAVRAYVSDELAPLETDISNLQADKLDAVNYTPVTDVNAQISDAASTISALDTQVDTNISDISANASDISVNASDISTNESNISTNATDITALQNDKLDAVNYTPVTDVNAQISTAASTVSGLDTQVDTNTTEISTNATDITALQNDKLDAVNYTPVTDVDGEVSTAASTVSGLDTQVDTNISDISTNASDISVNASDISTNESNISTNATDITALQNDKLDAVNYTPITDVDGEVSTAASTVSGLDTQVDTNTTEISNNADDPHGNAAHTETFISEGNGTSRDVYVINNGTFDASNYNANDIIFEKSS